MPRCCRNSRRDGWWHDPAQSEKLRAALDAALRALSDAAALARSRIDPVARFHLGNGARLERINWLGNTAPRGIQESFGIMVNYLYDHDSIEDNHEAFVRDGTIVRSPDVDALLATDRIAALASGATERRSHGDTTSKFGAGAICARCNQTSHDHHRRRDIMMMNRRTFSTALLAGAAASLISTRGMAANAAPAKARNVVLVHGLFADGSCWSEVIARLQAAGLNATAVQNPLTTLPEAVASAERVLARQDGPTVLVGHSFSGMIVTEAGVHPNVSALVYVAARAPDAGEDYTALAKTYPTPPASAGIVFDGDEGRLSEAAFLRDFAGDLPEAKAKVLYAVQEPFHKALLAGKTTHAAWRSKPSFYAVSTEDRTINPDLERFMAKRMGAKTIEVKASHLSLISHPDTITRLILEAAGQS